MTGPGASVVRFPRVPLFGRLRQILPRQLLRTVRRVVHQRRDDGGGLHEVGCRGVVVVVHVAVRDAAVVERVLLRRSSQPRTVNVSEARKAIHDLRMIEGLGLDAPDDGERGVRLRKDKPCTDQEQQRSFHAGIIGDLAAERVISAGNPATTPCGVHFGTLGSPTNPRCACAAAGNERIRYLLARRTVAERHAACPAAPQVTSVADLRRRRQHRQK